MADPSGFTVEDVLADIDRLVKAHDIDEPSTLTLEDYHRYGGKYDGRRMRPIGGWPSILEQYVVDGEDPQSEFPSITTELPKANRYIITAAQNATPVHAGFLKSLEVAAKHYNAQIVVVPLRYKNPTSQWTQAQAHHETWVEEVKPYLFRGRVNLNQNIVLAADIKTQPTASSPISGFEALTHAESCIIGHTKMQLKSVATSAYPKVVTTTGACTMPNYTDTKTGKIGEFHHFLGAIIVEVDGKEFHLRQLNADQDGGFIDLDKMFTPDGVEDAPPALGLVMGDTHVDFMDPGVETATFGKNGIADIVNPEYLVWHDVADMYSVNPHHAGDPFVNIAKAESGKSNAEAEVLRSVDFIESWSVGRKSVIVASNHNDFLNRWIKAADWKTLGTNAKFYLKLASAMLESTRMTDGGVEYVDAYVYCVEQMKNPDSNVRCLKLDESFKLANIECGLHGHIGPNGSRGTLKNLSRLGTKVVSGHTHTPGIEEGHYQVGTSTRLRLEYNHGPSSWLNTHCIIYANGARSLINIINGKWRL